MARRRGSYPGRPRSSGISRDWDSGPGSTALTQLTGSGSAILGLGIAATVGEITFMRTRGICDLMVQGVPTANGDGYFGAVGIGKTTVIAFTDVGITAIPTPITQVDWDGWLWHSFFSVHTPDVSGEGGNSTAQHQRIEIDSKAMRKVDGSELIYAAIEVVEIGTAILDVFLATRVLLQDSGS